MVSCDNDDHEGGRVPVRDSRSSSEDKEGKLVKLGERKGNGRVIEFLITWLGLPEPVEGAGVYSNRLGRH